MAFDDSDAGTAYAMPDPVHIEDGNGPLALAAGLVAGLVAGGLWALLVRVTGYEIGYAAWGVGLLVGWAMTRVTRHRSQSLALAAAAFAIIGLVAGKAFIFAGSAGAVAADYEGDDELMTNVVVWEMYENREFDGATLEEVDATRAAGDTLSDAVWENMRSQAAVRLAGMGATERHEAAVRAANTTLHHIGFVQGIAAQLSLFDLLWLLLAVGTAYRMLAPERQTEPEPQPA